MRAAHDTRAAPGHQRATRTPNTGRKPTRSGLDRSRRRAARSRLTCRRARRPRHGRHPSAAPTRSPSRPQVARDGNRGAGRAGRPDAQVAGRGDRGRGAAGACCRSAPARWSPPSTARRLAEPMRHVADRATRLGAGDFRPDPSRYGVPELDMVAEALDTSGSALAQLVQRERELVGDVSHQLRSRLTALQLRLETLAVHSRPGDRPRTRRPRWNRPTGWPRCWTSCSRPPARPARSARADRPGHRAARDGRRTGASCSARRAATLRLRVPDGLLARATPGRLREVHRRAAGQLAAPRHRAQ